jgi:transcriptional regulator with XRE-family HTH domain
MTTESVKWEESETFKSLQGKPHLGFAIKGWRKCEEITQTELAKQLGISKQLLSRYEAGQQLPSLQRTMEIAQALDAPVGLWLQYRLNDEMARMGLNATITVVFKEAV